MATPEPGRPAPRRFWIAWLSNHKGLSVFIGAGMLALIIIGVFSQGPHAIYAIRKYTAEWHQLRNVSSVAAHQVSIAVQSPSVQTRERLINDRFEQVAWTDWLLEQTMKTPLPSNWDPPAPSAAEATATDPQPNPDGTRTEPPPRTGRSKEVSPERPNANVKVGLESGKRVTGYGEQQKNWFQSMRGFRDLLRNERADAMLDDRHDMDGNTLYNLSFDTTILPNLGRRGYAAIKVLMTDDSADLGDGLQEAEPETNAGLSQSPEVSKKLNGYGTTTSRARALKRRDLFEIYLDWQNRLQTLLNNSVSVKAAEIDGNFLSQEKYINLERKYWVDICRELSKYPRSSRSDILQSRTWCLSIIDPAPKTYQLTKYSPLQNKKCWCHM